MTVSIPSSWPTRRGVLAGGAALTLTGCSGNLIGPPAVSPQIYALTPPFGPLDGPLVRWQLIVAVPVAPAVLDTQRIALTHAPNVMDYYASAEWTDRLPFLVQSMLVEAFEKSSRIAAVGRETAGLRPDYVLETEIREFAAFYAVIDTPPDVRVKMTAKLLGALDHEIAGTHDANQGAKAAANDLANITAAFTQAAGAAISEIAGWTLRTGHGH